MKPHQQNPTLRLFVSLKAPRGVCAIEAPQTAFNSWVFHLGWQHLLFLDWEDLVFVLLSDWEHFSFSNGVYWAWASIYFGPEPGPFGFIRLGRGSLGPSIWVHVGRFFAIILDWGHLTLI